MRLWLKVSLVWLLGCVCAWGAESVDAACQDVQSITHATRIVFKNNVVVDKSKIQIPDKIPQAWQNVNHRLQYEIEPGACVNPLARRALFIARIGGPYQIQAAGEFLAPIRSDTYSREQALNGRVGGVFSLANNNAPIVVSFKTIPNVSAGLIGVRIGSEEKIMTEIAVPHFRWQQFHHLIGMVLILTGLLGLMVWWVRRQDLASLWFGLSCLLWAFRGQMLQLFSIPIDTLLYEQLNYLLLLTAGVLVCISTLHSIGRMSLFLRRFLSAIFFIGLIGLAVSTYAAPLVANAYRTSAFLLGTVILLYAFGVLLNTLRSRRNSHFLWLAIGYIILLIGIGRDMATNLGFITPTWWTFLTPSFALLLICHFVAGGIYLVHNLQRSERTNEILEDAIAQKNAELKILYEESEAEKIRGERARLNREIHDGIGAQLMTALRGVERGALSQDQISESLQDGLDELRLLMDSADIGSDLHGALFAWRNRWEPRLNALDLSLNWRIGENITNVKLDQKTILQLIRILQESVANVVKHAKASQIDVAMHLQAQTLVLSVTDDGIGISDQAFGASHRGLKHMEQRATLIGASYGILKLEAPARGTEVRLLLKLAAMAS
jgi:signal transduction histidine kinase